MNKSKVLHMNQIQVIGTDYIRYASRSIDHLVVSNSNKRIELWIYNYEGQHFRVFESVTNAIQHINYSSTNSLIDFDNEDDLDSYLLNLKF
jgi:hypothetical protein